MRVLSSDSFRYFHWFHRHYTLERRWNLPGSSGFPSKSPHISGNFLTASCWDLYLANKESYTYWYLIVMICVLWSVFCGSFGISLLHTLQCNINEFLDTPAFLQWSCICVQNLSSYFKVIVGYEEVELKNQKPAPDGLLMCIEKLVGHNSGHIFYIGDHETDVKCVLNANNILSENKTDMKIISIGAFYGFEVDTSGWSVLPDFQIQNAADIKSIVNNFNHINWE